MLKIGLDIELILYKRYFKEKYYKKMLSNFYLLVFFVIYKFNGWCKVILV